MCDLILLGATTVVTSLSIACMKYYRLANKDIRTGAYNTRSFDTKLVRAMKRRYTFSLVFIDLDDFKKLNDTKGHQYGDKVLVKTVAVAQACIKFALGLRGGTVHRYGGDEFILFLPEVTTDEDLVSFTTKLKDGFQKAAIATTLGKFLYHPKYGVNYEFVLQKVDQDLYREKERRVGLRGVVNS